MGARGTEVKEEQVDHTGPATSGVFVKVPRDLHRQLKAEAALTGKQLGEFVAELLVLGIEQYPGLRVITGGHGKD